MALVFRSSVVFFSVDAVSSPSPPSATNKKSDDHFRWIYFENIFLDQNLPVYFSLPLLSEGMATLLRVGLFILFKLTVLYPNVFSCQLFIA